MLKRFSILSIFFLIFIISFPTCITIIDEYSYLLQAINLVEGNSDFFSLPGKYPVGTALFLAPIIKILGIKYVFVYGISALILSSFLIGKILIKLNLSFNWVFFLFLYVPTAFLSRSLMSEPLALLWSSIFFYIFFLFEKNNLTGVLLGLMTGLSLLIREPLIIILFPFLIWFLLQNKKLIPLTALGLVIGSSIRFFTNYWFYNDWIFIKPPGIGFGVNLFLANLILYVVLLMVFLPFGLLTAVNYNGREKYPIKFTIFTYFLFFLLYEYNGLNSGVFQSTILGGRFFIPLLPLLIITMAYWYESKLKSLKWVNIMLPISALACFLIVNITGKIYNRNQMKIISHLAEKEINAIYSDNSDQIYKYINPLYKDLENLKITQHLDEADMVISFNEGNTFNGFTEKVKFSNIGNKNIIIWEKN